LEISSSCYNFTTNSGALIESNCRNLLGADNISPHKVINLHTINCTIHTESTIYLDTIVQGPKPSHLLLKILILRVLLIIFYKDICPVIGNINFINFHNFFKVLNSGSLGYNILIESL